MVEVMVFSKDDKVKMYRLMLTIRLFEEKVFSIFLKGLTRGSSHFSIGEEASCVGISSALRKEDYLTTTHRGHGDCIAKGMKLDKMMAEICGKASGYCKGKGGSMHLIDLEVGMLGANGVVGGSIPIAVGAALSVKYKEEDRVAVSVFGDGAVNTGIFHESINLATIWKLPVIFVCKNNLYGLSTHVRYACSVPNIADRAGAYGIPGEKVDGMNVIDVRRTMEEAVKWARDGNGPVLIECMTYRFMGHSKSDPRMYRTREEEDEWKKKDPLKTYPEQLLGKGLITEDELKEIGAEVNLQVEQAEKVTLASSAPDVRELTTDVFYR